VRQAEVFSFNSNERPEADLDLSVRFYNQFPPEINKDLPVWNPRDESNQANNAARTDGTHEDGPLDAGTVGLFTPDSSSSVTSVNTVLALLAREPRMIDRLCLSFQPHTIRMQINSDGGTRLPGGFPLDWFQMVPEDNAYLYASNLYDAGYGIETWHSLEWIQRERDEIVNGWAQLKNSSTVEMYTANPELRDKDCRAWIVQRIVDIVQPAGVRRVHLVVKEKNLRAEGAELFAAENTTNPAPWLPSSYGPNEYAAAIGDLARELGERIGSENVSWRDSSGGDKDLVASYMPDDALCCGSVWQPNYLRQMKFDEYYP
jgi:hypothetical protein